jgi:hypothetical protein
MLKIIIGYFIANFILISSVALYLYQFSKAYSQVPDFDYLTFVVAVNSFITTISVALAAYKVITAKNVEIAVSEYMQKFKVETTSNYKELEKKMERLQNIRINSLTQSIDNLILISQLLAERTMIQQKINDKSYPQQEMALYTNEILKETISCLHMFLLTVSDIEGNRLLGYQRLVTFNLKEIKNYFKIKILEEDSEKNKTYLLNNL